MMSDNTGDKERRSTALQNIIKYWPVIVSVAILAGSAVETRIQVKQLLERDGGNKRQWQLISGHSIEITKLQQEILPLQQLDLQEWGYVRRQVEINRGDIQRYLRGRND